eukprot:CAMPEP_0113571930 /NCGR_PEP_ID=MMETSP0015_2-20120614/25822_1 /TAXON_ID=2838 /ORGANISM="Odontella" /LENGTH=177 /DNA_ID=CAMNT_0000474925 /DNA_START=178 /DNA_END=711 /DNA_ORIENTATION=+ /assembly_acc=CAM_ASM_000160
MESCSPRASPNVAGANEPASNKLAPAPGSLPTTLVKCRTIANSSTTVSIMLFSDRVFLSISQLDGKIGTMLQVTVEDSVIDMSRTYNITTLLGRRDDSLLEVYARQIGERIAALGGAPGCGAGGVDAATGEESGVCPPLLIGIALKKEIRENPENFKMIVDLVIESYKEAIKMTSAR